MHPYLFRIGNFPIPAFGLMVAIGFIMAMQYARRSYRRLQVTEDTVYDLALVIIIAALVGSRIVYLIVEWELFVRNPMAMIFSRQGYVFYGGFLFALFAGIAYVRLKNIPVWPAADAVAPAIALGHFFGRLGCYLNGCCFGHRCEMDGFLFRFPKVLDAHGKIDGSPPYWDHLMHGWISETDAWSLPIHPTQLYEATGLLLLFYILHRLLKNYGDKLPAGSVFLSYGAGYAVLRFVIEFFRGDDRGWIIPDRLSTSQGIALVVLMAVPIIWWKLKQVAPKQDHESKRE